MHIDHVAIWTADIDRLRDYYVSCFNGKAEEFYLNRETQFKSCFVYFESGTSIELMHKPGIPGNLNDRVGRQHEGIIHLAFGVETMENVREKAAQLEKAGYRILRGPRRTGDGFYEFETLDPDDNRIEVTTRFREG
jgi:lactoylglutathione lyase